MTLEPRKVPRQQRSKATVEAILDAYVEEVVRLGYRALTTHGIAARAGVSVGTLYQYFPNRDAVGGALVVRTLERMLAAMQRALADCIARNLDGLTALEHLLLTALDMLVRERAVFTRLAPEAPHLFRLPAAAALQRQLIEHSQQIRLSGGDRLDLPMPEADAWIIGHMVSASMLQVSLLDAPHEERVRLTREVARLVCRMALARGDQARSRSSAAA